MKQGRHYTNLILWILLAAIVVYFGYSVISSLYETLTTVTAVEYEAGAGYYTTGFVVRDEAVIQSGYGITVLSAAEGEHVSAGASIATGYLTDGAQQRQSRIADLRSAINFLAPVAEPEPRAAEEETTDAGNGEKVQDGDED